MFLTGYDFHFLLSAGIDTASLMAEWKTGRLDACKKERLEELKTGRLELLTNYRLEL